MHAWGNSGSFRSCPVHLCSHLVLKALLARILGTNLDMFLNQIHISNNTSNTKPLGFQGHQLHCLLIQMDRVNIAPYLSQIFPMTKYWNFLFATRDKVWKFWIHICNERPQIHFNKRDVEDKLIKHKLWGLFLLLGMILGGWMRGTSPRPFLNIINP